MRSRTFRTQELELNSFIDVSLIPFVDPDSENIFDRMEDYSYHDDILTKMPGSFPIYMGQEKYELESDMYSRIATEAINSNGIVCEYYVTTYDRDADPIWGEDCDRRAVRKFDFMVDPDGSLPEQRYTIDMWGIGEMETGIILTTKRHFNVASTRAGIASEGERGVIRGFEIDENKTFEPIEPKIGDIVRLKNDDQFYEIVFVNDRDSSNEFLQRRHYWKMTIKRFRDDQIEVSDSEGMEDAMFDLAKISNRLGIDDFDAKEDLKESFDDRRFDDREEIRKPRLDDATGSRSIGESGASSVDSWFD